MDVSALRTPANLLVDAVPLQGEPLSSASGSAVPGNCSPVFAFCGGLTIRPFRLAVPVAHLPLSGLGFVGCAPSATNVQSVPEKEPLLTGGGDVHGGDVRIVTRTFGTGWSGGAPLVVPTENSICYRCCLRQRRSSGLARSRRAVNHESEREKVVFARRRAMEAELARGETHLGPEPTRRGGGSTPRRRPVGVGTTKKSAAMSCPMWFARNVRPVCEGGCRWRTMYRATVA
jgi:hypothetical protein